MWNPQNFRISCVYLTKIENNNIFLNKISHQFLITTKLINGCNIPICDVFKIDKSNLNLERFFNAIFFHILLLIKSNFILKTWAHISNVNVGWPRKFLQWDRYINNSYKNLIEMPNYLIWHTPKDCLVREN